MAAKPCVRSTDRLALLATLLVGAAAFALGCGVTQSSYTCGNADCEVNLSGSGSYAELDSLGLTIVLDGTDDDTATLQVLGESGGPDETVELAEGESGEVLGNDLTLESVDGDEVTLTVAPG